MPKGPWFLPRVPYLGNAVKEINCPVTAEALNVKTRPVKLGPGMGSWTAELGPGDKGHPGADEEQIPEEPAEEERTDQSRASKQGSSKPQLNISREEDSEEGR